MLNTQHATHTCHYQEAHTQQKPVLVLLKGYHQPINSRLSSCKATDVKDTGGVVQELTYACKQASGLELP